MGAAALQPKLDCPCDGELGRPEGEGVITLKSKVGFDLAFFVWAPGCLGSGLSGLRAVWAPGCLGSGLSGLRAVWASGCLGAGLSGLRAVWAPGCLGSGLSGLRVV